MVEKVGFVAGDGARLSLVRRGVVRGSPRAVCLLTHAMLTSSRYFERGFAATLAAAGVESWRLDFRGCGDSAGGAPAGFDDYARLDVPAALAEVARRSGVAAGELGYLGHSLGGLAGVAAFASGAAAPPRRLVLAATQLFRPDGGWRDRGFLALWDGFARVLGRIPARALRAGSEDAPGPYARDFSRWAHGGRFDGADGVDYRARAGDLATPTLVLVSSGDRLCTPAQAAGFAACVGGPKQTVVVGGGGFQPDHFALLTDVRAAAAWRRVAGFLAG